MRDDARQADVVVQTSDTTWQAYNRYGGASLYCAGGPGSATSARCTGRAAPDRAAKVSYNRPFDTRDHDAQSFLFNAEYPMVRWLEANGYDVKYIAGVDTDRRGAPILVGAKKPKAFFSVGHDEYWSAAQRASVESRAQRGRQPRVLQRQRNLLEDAVRAEHRRHDHAVSHARQLQGHAGRRQARSDAGRGDRHLARHALWPAGADGGRPENSLTGTIWTVNSGTSAITVPASMANLRFWRNTRVADLTAGVATLGPTPRV